MRSNRKAMLCARSVGSLQLRSKDRLEFRNDDRVRQGLMAECEASHTEEHTGKRRYAEDAWFQGETYPDRMPTIRIDAPTQHQFDLPRQRR
eukprot:625625-Prymnesium_polylepis.1